MRFGKIHTTTALASHQNLGHLERQAEHEVRKLLRQTTERGAQAKADAMPPHYLVCGKAPSRLDSGHPRTLTTRIADIMVERQLVSIWIGDGVKKDSQEAAKWYRKAAYQNYAPAQYGLGLCFAKGDGVAKDEGEAVEWYRKAAEQGFADAEYQLGGCCASGRGVTKDAAETVKWERKAAEQGNPDGQAGVGGAYLLGFGVPKDYVEAYMWLNLVQPKATKE